MDMIRTQKNSDRASLALVPLHFHYPLPQERPPPHVVDRHAHPVCCERIAHPRDDEEEDQSIVDAKDNRVYQVCHTAGEDEPRFLENVEEAQILLDFFLHSILRLPVLRSSHLGPGSTDEAHDPDDELRAEEQDRQQDFDDGESHLPHQHRTSSELLLLPLHVGVGIRVLLRAQRERSRIYAGGKPRCGGFILVFAGEHAITNFRRLRRAEQKFAQVQGWQLVQHQEALGNDKESNHSEEECRHPHHRKHIQL
mmetsp:Transcript_87244/g.208693  ORF Transcript_87244/g.208693 Transcript_87244/m.208693 type:complete len:253 (-) Transcript_87244:1900-2658(-)